MTFTSRDSLDRGPTGYLAESAVMVMRNISLPDDTVPSFWGTLRGAACGDLTGDGANELCLDIGIVPGPVVVGSLPTVTWSLAVPIEAVRLTADDLDGDGTAELLLWDPPQHTVRLLPALAPGDHDLASVASASFEAAGSECSAITSGGDLDNDGTRDFVVAVDDAVFVVTDTTADSPLDSAHARLDFQADALAVADLDKDGLTDLVVGGQGEVYVFFGPIDAGSLTLPDAAIRWVGLDYDDTSSGYAPFGFALHAGDADLDGDIDLLIGAPQDTEAGRLYFVPGPIAR